MLGIASFAALALAMTEMSRYRRLNATAHGSATVFSLVRLRQVGKSTFFAILSHIREVQIRSNQCITVYEWWRLMAGWLFTPVVPKRRTLLRRFAVDFLSQVAGAISAVTPAEAVTDVSPSAEGRHAQRMEHHMSLLGGSSLGARTAQLNRSFLPLTGCPIGPATLPAPFDLFGKCSMCIPGAPHHRGDTLDHELGSPWLLTGSARRTFVVSRLRHCPANHARRSERAVAHLTAVPLPMTQDWSTIISKQGSIFEGDLPSRRDLHEYRTLWAALRSALYEPASWLA